MENNRINYIEFPSTDLGLTKKFYEQSFGWQFTDYGPEYAAFSDGSLDGGFYKAEEAIGNGGALVILYHTDLNYIKDQIIKAGGQLSKDIFSFPGGSRFHFLDPSGNELAVWTDK